MIRWVASVATAVLLALPVTAAAQTVQGCPPGTFGVVVYYQDPRGWITIHVPLCFGPR